MNASTKILPHIEGSDNETNFLDAMRGKRSHRETLAKGTDPRTGEKTHRSQRTERRNHPSLGRAYRCVQAGEDSGHSDKEADHPLPLEFHQSS